MYTIYLHIYLFSFYFHISPTVSDSNQMKLDTWEFLDSLRQIEPKKISTLQKTRSRPQPQGTGRDLVMELTGLPIWWKSRLLSYIWYCIYTLPKCTSSPLTSCHPKRKDSTLSSLPTSIFLCFFCCLTSGVFSYLEPQTIIYKWMFGETTIFYMKIWNHPIDFQPFIYGWPWGSRYGLCWHNCSICSSTSMGFTPSILKARGTPRLRMFCSLPAVWLLLGCRDWWLYHRKNAGTLGMVS